MNTFLFLLSTVNKQLKKITKKKKQRYNFSASQFFPPNTDKTPQLRPEPPRYVVISRFCYTSGQFFNRQGFTLLHAAPITRYIFLTRWFCMIPYS